MGVVKRLSDQVVNQIAAGEVIERPVSIVRELVDNSLDAGASKISVSLLDGGRSYIKVVDDGCGISGQDLPLAIERHATSKISASSDLDNIGTLGFRGEALPSIGSVSHLKITSRVKDCDVGNVLEVNGGKVFEPKPVACAIGSKVEIRSLFFNTPARRKFLRTAGTETRRVKQWLGDLCLAYPHVAFSLTVDNKPVWKVAPSSDIFTRAKQLRPNLSVPFRNSLGEVSIEGLLAHPGQALFDSSGLTLIVNGRLVRDRVLLRAVREGYQSTLKAREYPCAVVSLKLPQASVDVNVHPQKSEVRFKNSQGIFEFVRNSVLTAVSKFNQALEAVAVNAGSIAPIPMRASPSGGSSSYQKRALEASSQDKLFFSNPPTVVQVADDAVHQVFEVEKELKFQEMTYLGQLFKCYLLCEHHERFYVVDMHAAHERINYNRIRQGYRDRDVPSQRLLIPLEVKLPASSVDRCMEAFDFFERYGFEIDQFGEDTLIVRAVPAIVLANAIPDLIREISAFPIELESEGAFEALVDSVAARIACHGSIRSGKLMKPSEAYALLAQLDQANLAGACPHGRPVVVSYHENEVERWFGRDK